MSADRRRAHAHARARWIAPALLLTSACAAEPIDLPQPEATLPQAVGSAGRAPAAGAPGASAQAGRAPVGSAVARKDPTGGFFVGVSANGTGCPAGTWEANISADGQTFTMTFSQYEAEVSPSTTLSVKDCELSLKLSSPQGLTFSIPSIYYGGYAFLEEGVQGRLSANYGFRDTTLRVDQPVRNLTGPYDDAFLFEHGARGGGSPWAPCGTDRIARVTTQLRVQNSRPGRSGYMNMTAVDASMKLLLKLAWRPCRAPTVTPGGGVTAQGLPDNARGATSDNEVWVAPKVVETL